MIPYNVYIQCVYNTRCLLIMQTGSAQHELVCCFPQVAKLLTIPYISVSQSQGAFRPLVPECQMLKSEVVGCAARIHVFKGQLWL